jgi:hypothetical protein
MHLIFGGGGGFSRLPVVIFLNHDHLFIWLTAGWSGSCWGVISATNVVLQFHLFHGLDGIHPVAPAAPDS